MEEAEERVQKHARFCAKKYPQYEEFQASINSETLSVSCATNSKTTVEQVAKVNALVPRDLPALQLTGGRKWDARKDVHTSCRSFSRAFTAQLDAYGMDRNDHWERLLKICLNDNQQIWFDNKLGKKGYSWKEAEEILLETFDTPAQQFFLLVDTFHMRQRRDESISEYIDRFQTSRLESGSEENQNLVAAFVASLSPQHSKDVCAEVISQLGEKTKDLDSVCSLVRRICKDNKRQHEDDVQESARFVRAKPNYSAKRHRDNRARSP
ncbi:hypothetical protein DFQ29_003480, partial [Apophysomyces sp. BC1021]